MYNRSSFSIGKSQYYINMYMCLESYFKAHVLRGWAHNLAGLIIRRLLCKYRGKGGSLFITENEIHLWGFNWESVLSYDNMRVFLITLLQAMPSALL